MSTGYAKRRSKADRIETLVATLDFLKSLRDDVRLMRCEKCDEEQIVPVRDADRLSATRQIGDILDRLEKLGWVEPVSPEGVPDELAQRREGAAGLAVSGPADTDVRVAAEGVSRPRRRRD